MTSPAGRPSPNESRSPANERCAAATLRFEHDLHALVLLVLEYLVPFGRLVEPQPVGDDEARVDLALLNPLQQRAHVALRVTLPALDRQRAVHYGAHRELVDDPTVDADHRDGATIAAGHDRLAQRDGPVGL